MRIKIVQGTGGSKLARDPGAPRLRPPCCGPASHGPEAPWAAVACSVTRQQPRVFILNQVDGDQVIADTAQDGGFLATCSKFEEYVRTRFAPTWLGNNSGGPSVCGP